MPIGDPHLHVERRDRTDRDVGERRQDVAVEQRSVDVLRRRAEVQLRRVPLLGNLSGTTPVRASGRASRRVRCRSRSQTSHLPAAVFVSNVRGRCGTGSSRGRGSAPASGRMTACGPRRSGAGRSSVLSVLDVVRFALDEQADEASDWHVRVKRKDSELRPGLLVDEQASEEPSLHSGLHSPTAQNSAEFASPGSCADFC